MKNYEHVLKTVELALAKGEYNFCVESLSPIIDSYPLSTKEGVNLRTILITALCGTNQKEDAKRYCKELLKSNDYKSRENAKYLMEIIDSPEIKKPDNWNIKFEKNFYLDNNYPNSINLKKNNVKKKIFINVTDTPTGETKSFQKGFSIIILLILFLLIPLLSGCVKIEETLDLSEIDSITTNLKVESKYINKFPWQMKFEEEIKSIFPNAEISIGQSNFSMINKDLSINNTEKILKKVQRIGGELANLSTNLEVNTTQKNFFFLKKYNYKIDFNLKRFSNIEELEINFKFITPNKTTITKLSNPKAELIKNLIIWNLVPGRMNSLEFSFWIWNKLFIGIGLVALVMIMAYSIRFYRFKIGSDLPQLPPN